MSLTPSHHILTLSLFQEQYPSFLTTPSELFSYSPRQLRVWEALPPVPSALSFLAPKWCPHSAFSLHCDIQHRTQYRGVRSATWNLFWQVASGSRCSGLKDDGTLILSQRRSQKGWVHLGSLSTQEQSMHLHRSDWTQFLRLLYAAFKLRKCIPCAMPVSASPPAGLTGAITS